MQAQDYSNFFKARALSTHHKRKWMVLHYLHYYRRSPRWHSVPWKRLHSCHYDTNKSTSSSGSNIFLHAWSARLLTYFPVCHCEILSLCCRCEVPVQTFYLTLILTFGQLDSSFSSLNLEFKENLLKTWFIHQTICSNKLWNRSSWSNRLQSCV